MSSMALLVVLQLITLIALIVLLLRRQVAPQADPRLAQIPDQMTRMDVRSAAAEESVQRAFAQMRQEIADEAKRSREASETAFRELRGEVTKNIAELSQLLQTGLSDFRNDNKTSGNLLREAVERQMQAITQRIASFTQETNQQHTNLRESLNSKLADLMTSNTTLQDRLRTAVEERLTKLNESNTAKLEEMRVTVDEKLHATLQTRLTESFGQVTTHLGEVQKGLGEMKELATGVGDLKKVLSNVKTRGIMGEFVLGQQLEQMFSPEQYLKNARIRPETQEQVEYALKIPNGGGEGFSLLAIDSKFPKENWEHLEHAYEGSDADAISGAARMFERAIRTQAKTIHDKYIDPPTTLPHAIMFLPTENIYAEVVRRPGLLSEIQSQYRVTIAGPSTFMAILTSFQMGFHTLAIQKKGDEVWRVLSNAKTEFEKFGGLMDKVEKQVGTVQTTLRDIKGKTKTINRALKSVSSLDTTPGRLDAGETADNLLSFGEVPALAASAEED
jgi:DNA recombination protein RmuC